METAQTILYALSEAAARDASPSIMTEYQNALAALLIEKIKERPWRIARHSSWYEHAARDAAELIVDKVMDMHARRIKPSMIRKTLDEMAANPLSAMFLTAAAVHVIYSDHPGEWDAFVNEGANYHCRIIRRAAALAVRRHVAGMNRFSIDAGELEDELFGMVMEEIVRCLSDPASRIWTRKSAEPESYPAKGARGMRRGMMMRVALSPEGDRLASLRTDNRLFVWDLAARELMHAWDLQMLDSPPGNMESALPEHLFFSVAGDRIAVEFATQKVYVLSMADAAVQQFGEADRQRFLRWFGAPFRPDRSESSMNDFRFSARSGETLSLDQYSRRIYDWSRNATSTRLATASETDRLMPEWMQKAGFERAVHHIAKKRLIDLIRKRTHTNYACWRCGSMSSSLSDAQCRRCGADFTRCPLGCEAGEELDFSNRWQCPHCGMNTRIAESSVQVEVDEWHADPRSGADQWSDSHDMERILEALKNASIAYKKKDIPCSRLIALKAQGKTNEDIGVALGVPRGSVDYIWSQCKKQITLTFGEI
ncbi:MAG: hypothetical protein JXR73_01920 [Candidatus Omnitrophica bacterium]|nr:hypothetical protein [Candidatus Omnitrophota bacterium]